MDRVKQATSLESKAGLISGTVVEFGNGSKAEFAYGGNFAYVFTLINNTTRNRVAILKGQLKIRDGKVIDTSGKYGGSSISHKNLRGKKFKR